MTQNQVDPGEIDLGIISEEKKPSISRVPTFYKKVSYKEIIELKKTLFENEFSKLFRFVTSSVDYKAKIFFQRVKLVLEVSRLTVYEHKENSKEISTINYNPLLVLDFNQITAYAKVYASQNKFKILVLGTNAEFEFKASSKEVFDNLLIHLNYSIENSEGAKINLLGISLRKDFYKNYYMFENEFRDKAKSGDLLIFRGFECPAKCQRCFTGAHYDHIALLHKKNDELYVYESTSKDGCMRRLWREFVQFLWNLLYDKMVYRELIIDLEENKKKNFESQLELNCDLFIKETEKKKYQLSCCALCFARKSDSEKNNEWSKSKGFFCSQLVAAAYLQCNILKYTKATGLFLPGAFAQDKCSFLQLEQNFSLGPEIIIDFSS